MKPLFSLRGARALSGGPDAPKDGDVYVSISRSFRLEAARFLPRLPASHPCSRLHGHSFVVEVALAGPIDPMLGWLVDYDEIAAAWAPIAAALDHRLLNEVDGLANPTSELLAHWIFTRLAPGLPALTAVTVMETPETRATYRPDADGRPGPASPSGVEPKL